MFSDVAAMLSIVSCSIPQATCDIQLLARLSRSLSNDITSSCMYFVAKQPQDISFFFFSYHVSPLWKGHDPHTVGLPSGHDPTPQPFLLTEIQLTSEDLFEPFLRQWLFHVEDLQIVTS